MPSSGDGKGVSKYRKAKGPKNAHKERLDTIEAVQRKGVSMFAQDIQALFENQKALVAALEDFDLTLGALIGVTMSKHGVTHEELTNEKDKIIRIRTAAIEQQETLAKKLAAEGEILKTVQEVAAEGGGETIWPKEAFLFGGQ